MRSRFIAGCEESTGQLAESIRIAFCEGSDPADILNVSELMHNQVGWCTFHSVQGQGRLTTARNSTLLQNDMSVG